MEPDLIHPLLCAFYEREKNNGNLSLAVSLAQFDVIKRVSLLATE